MQINANAARCENDGYATVLAFADDPSDPKHYVILQFVNKPSKQDVLLGQGGVHVEVGGIQGAEGYGVIQQLSVINGDVLVQINPRVAFEANIDNTILVKLNGQLMGDLTLAEAVELFRQRIS